MKSVYFFIATLLKPPHFVHPILLHFAIKTMSGCQKNWQQYYLFLLTMK